MTDAHAASGLSPEIQSRVEQWLADDPDPTTSAATQALLTGIEDSTTDQQSRATAVAELTNAFGSWLAFGTAGLRGPLGPGPNRMNSAIVMRAAAALGDYLYEQAAGHSVGAVVVGYDARHGSAQFARDTCAVLSGAGVPVMVLPRALPTPVLAFALRRLDAAAAVMVTASHNPARDNGYKVYLGARSGLPYAGSQLVPPADTHIAARFQAITSVRQLPLGDEWVTLDDDIISDYLDSCVAVTHPAGPRDIRVVHTAMHGVGSQCFRDAAAAAGFADVHSVIEQAEPHPDFPTVAFPNPEEPGAFDLACAQATRINADIVIAHDPDADRCAVAVFHEKTCRQLSGDDIGLLLGWWRLEQHDLGWRRLPTDAVFATSIVSGSALSRLCESHGVQHTRTLTGFKWLAQVRHLAYGYEEALGYCVDPDSVRDKDGISAALSVMECAAYLKNRGATLWQQVDALRRELRAPVTGQVVIDALDPVALSTRLDQLLRTPPATLGSVVVSGVDDLSCGLNELGYQLPPTAGLRLRLADGGRVIIRPSGTEPKVKAYVECRNESSLREITSATERLMSLAQ